MFLHLCEPSYLTQLWPRCAMRGQESAHQVCNVLNLGYLVVVKLQLGQGVQALHRFESTCSAPQCIGLILALASAE
jgi:hypothetical protein